MIWSFSITRVVFAGTSTTATRFLRASVTHIVTEIVRSCAGARIETASTLMADFLRTDGVSEVKFNVRVIGSMCLNWMTTSLSYCFVFCIKLFIDISVQYENIREYFWRCTKWRQPCDCGRPSVDATGDDAYFPKNTTTVMRSACDILNCMCVFQWCACTWWCYIYSLNVYDIIFITALMSIWIHFVWLESIFLICSKNTDTGSKSGLKSTLTFPHLNIVNPHKQLNEQKNT